MDDIVDCPFCPFAAIVEDIEEDTFRCERPGCRIVSCRKCRGKVHPKMTCEGSELDVHTNEENQRLKHGAVARHEVEEEMAKAVLRYCPKCKHGPFAKDSGCNRVKCPKCKHRHCYACGAAVPQYAVHYGSGKLCPLFEDTNERLKNEAAAAQERIVREVMEKQPDLSAEDIIVDQSLLQRGLNYAWNALPNLALQVPEEADARRRQDVERQQPRRNDGAWNDPVLLVVFHTIHGVILASVFGLTIGLIKNIQHSSGLVNACLHFVIFTVFSSILSKFLREYGAISAICFSIPAAIATSVYLGHGKFGSIPVSTV